MTPEEQNWLLIKNYLTLPVVKALQYEEILLFILSLNSCIQGEGYAINKLTKDQKYALNDFSVLGYVFLTDKYFYPTELGINLSTGRNSNRCIYLFIYSKKYIITIIINNN